jgi:hypothetical protein
MPWEARKKVPSKAWLPRRHRAAGRFHVPFWVGWTALIAVAGIFYLLANPMALPSTDYRTYQCHRNVYDCSDFRARTEAQAGYQACGGLRNDVHRLDRDRDGLACERLP